MIRTVPAPARPGRRHSPSLPASFRARPAGEGLRPIPATTDLVRREVKGILTTSPAYRALDAEKRRRLAHDLVRVSSYAAECAREVWWQSGRLGQEPRVRIASGSARPEPRPARPRRSVPPVALARAQTAGSDFTAGAAERAPEAARRMLRAIAFPDFVTDLIRGTFRAIIDSNIQQMEAYGQLLSNVGKTVDQFMADNITDNQARDWLAQRYPEHLRIREGRVAVREGAEDRPPPDFRTDLQLGSQVGMDGDAIEENLVPAARRHLAESRLQMLSTMVLMGVNRIVVTDGKIRATMSFHIDTTDRSHEERATDLDFRTGASIQAGFGPWSAAANASFAYVTSERRSSDSELNMDADLTGEVDIRFRSDYFPLSRFAPPGTIAQIQGNTAVPDANAPAAESLDLRRGRLPGMPGTKGDRAARSARPLPTVPSDRSCRPSANRPHPKPRPSGGGAGKGKGRAERKRAVKAVPAARLPRPRKAARSPKQAPARKVEDDMKASELLSAPALAGPFGEAPSPEGLELRPATLNLVRNQVRALLESSPSFYDLPAAKRKEMAQNLVKIGTYSAALIQEDWAQSKRLGQTPVLKRQEILVGPGMALPAALPETAARPYASGRPGARALEKEAAAPADEFSPRAANQVARITRETLNAVAFPTFVADLIKGTFQAIVEASIQQMEAYGELLANVAKTVDQFMSDNITDNQARDWLASSYPGHIQVEMGQDSARLRVRRGAEDLPGPDFRRDLGLQEEVKLEDDAIEKSLVPAARRRLAQSRHQMLSTMVLLGINRIVVTNGKIRAQMVFRIDTKDHGAASSASQFDLKNETSYGAGGGLGALLAGPSVQTKNTIAYVSSSKRDSSDDIDVSASLTGEVELKFKSDYFPLDRLSTPEMLSAIQGNTVNPAANQPNTGTAAAAGSGPKTET